MNGNEDALSLKIDAMTAQRLVNLAKTWGVTEEEAIRRAIDQANAPTGSISTDGRLEAFKKLQRRLNLTPAKATEWQHAVYWVIPFDYEY